MGAFQNTFQPKPAPPAPLVSSYLTVIEAEQLAAALPALPSWAAASADTRLRVLGAASRRVDSSRRWQGRRLNVAQPLEFPRVPYDGESDVWDIDAAGQAVVPLDVLIAVLYEADSMLDGERQRLMDARHNGLASQTTGPLSESYVPATGPGGQPVLCRQADDLLRKYRLRSGGMR